MNSYDVILTPAFERELRKLPKQIIGQILEDLQILKSNPFPHGDRIKKIKTAPGNSRLRSGDYRVVFRIEGNEVIVLRVFDKKDFEKILRSLHKF